MFSLRNTTQELNDSTDYVEFKRGIKISIPMLLGIIPFALVLGTQATQKGFSHLEVPLFTGLNLRAVPSLLCWRSGPIHQIFSF